MDLTNQRQDYSMNSIDIESVDDCPFKQFENWFENANAAKLLEPNAMTLSTVDSQGRPTQRTVLLKIFDTDGFVFFTNYGSRKAQHISENPNVSLLFPWLGLQRQVEISGTVEKISSTESIKYFASRPRGSQLGAWVSNQSSVISTRSVLRSSLSELTKRFQGGAVPMPKLWGGFRVVPVRFEFWQGGADRLHDRIEYLPSADNSSWQRSRLSP